MRAEVNVLCFAHNVHIKATTTINHNTSRIVNLNIEAGS